MADIFDTLIATPPVEDIFDTLGADTTTVPKLDIFDTLSPVVSPTGGLVTTEVPEGVEPLLTGSDLKQFGKDVARSTADVAVGIPEGLGRLVLGLDCNNSWTFICSNWNTLPFQTKVHKKLDK